MIIIKIITKKEILEHNRLITSKDLMNLLQYSRRQANYLEDHYPGLRVTPKETKGKWQILSVMDAFVYYSFAKYAMPNFQKTMSVTCHVLAGGIRTIKEITRKLLIGEAKPIERRDRGLYIIFDINRVFSAFKSDLEKHANIRLDLK